MATKRIKDLTNTATTVASDEYLAVDGTTNGTSKITRDNFRTDTAAAFVAAPGTYNLAPLSGGAVPIDKGGTAATTAAGARTSLDVPSNSEAVLVANDLSDVTAATARTNLSVNSIDEDAEATGTKLVGPAMYFDGTNDFLEVADDAKLSFTDGTDDLPFSVSAWVKMEDATNFTIVAKWGSSTATREWYFASYNDLLELRLKDSAGNEKVKRSSATLTGYEGQWIHVAATYGGSGPNSATSFSSATDEMTLFVNGSSIATSTGGTTYNGMVNTTQVVRTGFMDYGGNRYAKGHIKEVKIFNRELTAAEVAQLARGNDLGFADEFGGANGGAYTSDFSSGVDGWVVLSNLTLTGNVDSVGPGGDLRDDTLRLVPNTTNGQHAMYKNTLTGGKRFRVSLDYYIPSANSNIDGFRITLGSAGSVSNVTSATKDLWTHHDFEGVCDVGSGLLLIYATDGGSTTFQDAGGDDTMYVRNIKATEIGTLADFRSERFDSSTGKWYDLSDNAFVGTNTGATLVGREVPVYETGTWTPSITFGGGSTGITYTTQEGLYTRVGNTVWVSAYVLLSAKGADTGTALVNGLPFTASNTAASSQSFVVGNAANAANLTSAITAYATDNGTTVNLVDWGATGSAVLDDTNFAATTSLSITGTYQIQ